MTNKDNKNVNNNEESKNENRLCQNCETNVVFNKLSEIVGKDLDICANCLEDFMRSGKVERLTQEQIDKVIAFIESNKQAEKSEFAMVPVDKNKKEQELKSAEFGRDLSKLAKEGAIDDIIGREKEIEQTVLTLSRKYKSNPLLVGEPGVGKTAIIEGIAKKIEEGTVPNVLKGKRILEINVGDLVAGTKYRGEFEARMKTIIDEVKNAKNVLLFFDEFHSLMDAGGAEGAVDAVSILKPAIARGDIQIIGATTHEEYRKHIAKDGAFSRRMQVIDIKEPNEEETIEIMFGLKKILEDHHQVEIQSEAIEYAVKLSNRYLREKHQPDKTIDLLDEASSLKKITKKTNDQKLNKIKKEQKSVAKKKDKFLGEDRLQEAKEQLELELSYNIKIKELEQELIEQDKSQSLVTAEEINLILEKKTGIPVSELTTTDREKVKSLGENLKKYVKGQERAIKEVTRFIKRSKMKMKDPNRPTGVFLFLGPTGVGKTELAKALATELFGNRDAMIRFDMSEFMEKHSVSKMIGSPPGYVGHEDGGKLTNMLRRKPYSIVLFDEIEKAHPDVLNVMLQLFEDGVITDSKGKQVDARNAVFIMTSNAGSANYNKGTKGLGFKTDSANENEKEKIEEKVLEKIRKDGHFKPEFLNRIDSIVAFNALDDEAMMDICSKMTEDITKRVQMEGYELVFTEESKTHINKTGYKPEHGAREMKRLVESVTDLLTDAILMDDKPKYTVKVKEDKLIVE